MGKKSVGEDNTIIALLVQQITERAKTNHTPGHKHSVWKGSKRNFFEEIALIPVLGLEHIAVLGFVLSK